MAELRRDRGVHVCARVCSRACVPPSWHLPSCTRPVLFGAKGLYNEKITPAGFTLAWMLCPNFAWYGQVLSISAFPAHGNGMIIKEHEC